MSKKVAFQKKKKKKRNVTRTRPSLLTSVLLFRDQVLPSKGTWEKKKKGLPRCFTWHLCTCICRGGRWGGGGGRDKVSDEVGLLRLLAFVVTPPHSRPLCSYQHLSHRLTRLLEMNALLLSQQHERLYFHFSSWSGVFTFDN